MYWDKIIWFIAWPAMIAISYYLGVYILKKFKNQIENDPTGEGTMP